MRCTRFIVICGVLLVCAPLFAQTVAVGTCKPSLVSFATIQAAATSSPAGVTIDVCPGTYPEQVTINKKLTLKGISSANHNAAVITVPAGGLVPNATSLSSGNGIAAQILVQNAGPVVISDITVDGSNNGITGCLPNPIGIYYQNSSGTISRTSVLNEVLGSGLTGCQAGLGIFVQSGNSGTSTVSVLNNQVENYQKNGITGNEIGTTVTVTGNTVIGQGPVSGAAENSIQIGFGATGSMSGNSVGSDIWAPDVFGDTGDAAAGLLVYASTNVTISSNNVQNTQYGIAIAGDPVSGSGDSNVVTKNTVSATHLYDGIDLCGNSNSASHNIINGSDEAGVHIDDTCGTGANTNSVTYNTINSACAGVLVGPSASGSTTAPNTYFNAATLVMSGSDVCTPALRPTGAAATKRTPIKAVRP